MHTCLVVGQEGIVLKEAPVLKGLSRGIRSHQHAVNTPFGVSGLPNSVNCRPSSSSAPAFVLVSVAVPDMCTLTNAPTTTPQSAARILQVHNVNAAALSGLGNLSRRLSWLCIEGLESQLSTSSVPGLGQLTRLTRLQLLNSKGFQPILLSGMFHLEVRGTL